MGQQQLLVAYGIIIFSARNMIHNLGVYAVHHCALSNQSPCDATRLSSVHPMENDARYITEVLWRIKSRFA